ncbi:hypothetical protein R5R35_003835 [Gryllus longicercus]|uniref:Uncharacterized protein n=1 Tax=Gryllus longicercus TaxID=2509291 RepID=A0AAN9Z7R4_9ORTH
MAVDSRYSQVMNVKRKLYSWVMSFLGESKDSASECASGKQLVPDAKDIVGILKSTGFRLVDVAMGQNSAGAASNALCCRVIVTCAKSGLSAVLESEAECRCPEEAMGDGASTWCVMSPSASQESLDKSWNVTASSLMPNVASHVAEVVGAATRFLVQLLEDKGLPTPARGAAAFGRAARARGATQDLSRALSGRTPSLPVLPMDTPGSNTRRGYQPWLEDLQWELALREPPLPDISGLSLSGSQSFSRSENQLPQVGVIGPPRRQSSTLEDYALQGKLSEDEDAKVVFDEHMRLTEQTRVLRSPSYAVAAAADAKSTATSPPAAAAAAAAAATATATATTTTTATPAPALASAVPAGAIAAEVSAPAAKVSAPAQFRVPVSAADVGDGNQQTQTSTGNDCNGQQANTALLLPRRAQEALQTAEGFMQNMSSIMEMLRMWTMPVEDPPVGAESKRPRARTDVLVPPPNVVRASPRATSPALLVPRAGPARKSAPAGGLKVNVTRPTKSRTLAARAALRLRTDTPRPSTARVNAHLGPAERAGVIRAAARGQSQRAAAASMARASAPASARASAPAPATPPVGSVSAPSGSPTVSPTTGPPPQPPPRRPSLECADNSSGAPGAASPRAAAGTTITTRVMFTSSGAAGRTISRVPPVRSAPPPPPKPLKRPPK